MAERSKPTIHERWAHLRFSVVGHLLASPPPKGELHAALEALAAKTWRHPSTGEAIRFGVSTIERWYYQARRETQDPVSVLRRRVRKDAGQHASIGDSLRQQLLDQYTAHKGWSVQLHYDNLAAAAEACPTIGPLPSYSTIRRYMRASGMFRRKWVASIHTAGTERAEARLDSHEVRSYEAPYVNGLWHWDCHSGSLKVISARAEWLVPVLFAVLDDCSRLCCHAQWYLVENAENVAHGLSQGFQKRGLPRAGMSDRGQANRAAEITQGLARLGIPHELTLEYSPYQNGKIENFWTQAEGRLLAMLEDVPDLTLEFLNEATQAWVEQEYNREIHSEIGQPPLTKFLAGPEVTRLSPDSAVLRLAFTRAEVRTQRRSDGTVTIGGCRFEIPNRYRHLVRATVRYADWDLGRVHLVDPVEGKVLCRLYPLDKTQNASGLRRPLESVDPELTAAAKPAQGLPPLLAKLLAKQGASGLPPAYLPKGEGENS